MLTLLYSLGGQDVRGELLERMGRSAARGRVLLVPDQYSHEMERAVCRILGNAGARNCEVLSFTRLWSRVTEVAGGGAMPVLDEGGRMLVLYRAVRQSKDLLKAYRTFSRKPAFLTRLMASLAECRNYGVVPEKLVQAGERLGGPRGEKLSDIGVVYGLYEELLKGVQMDSRTRLERLAEKLKESQWARDKEIWMWGFDEFNTQEERVIRALLGQCDVTVAIAGDIEHGEDPHGIFDSAKRLAAGLCHLARSENVKEKKERLFQPIPRRESLRFLEDELFCAEYGSWKGDCDVVRMTAADPRQEMEWTAAEILRLVREEGYRFRDISVCARNFASYEELAESVFARYGVPVYLSAKSEVLQKPVLALVTSALAAAAENYPYDEMFRYLKTGLTGLTEEEQDLLENYVLTWDIKGGTWVRQKAWDMHPEGYGLQIREEHTELLHHLDDIRRRVIAPLEKLRKNGDHTGRGHALALYQMLEEIDLPRRLEERAAALEERGELRTAAEYRQLWEILARVLEQCALLLGDMELDLEEFSPLFSLALSQNDVGTIPVSLDRVTAGDTTRMESKEVKVLFLLGADSASIPSCPAETGLFNDQDREALVEKDIRLGPKQTDRLQRELAVVYHLCLLPQERFYVSFSTGDGAGGERTPSFLYQRLGLLFPDGEEVRPEGGRTYRLAAPGPAMELAGEREDVAAALSAHSDYKERVARISSAADWRRGCLSQRGVDTLYGGTVPMSATRLDLYNSCHFSHFMKFGLDARPRQKAKFRPSDYGTFIHAVLEEVLTRGLEMPGGIRFLAEDESLRRSVTADAIERYERETLGGLEEETARFRHTFARMKQSAQAVADSVVEELASSDFEPSFFELGFGRGQTLPPLEVEKGVRLRLTGFVDRVDSWVKDGKRYLRVVDYKTGRKAFEFSDVADGRGLQMLLYLFALRREGQFLFGPEELVPAGVLYVPARNPVVSGDRGMTDEAIAAAQQKELKRKGLVLDDQGVLDAMEHTDGEYKYLPIGSVGRSKHDYLVSPEQMDVLDDYLTHSLEGVADQLAQGNIDADPYWHDKEKNACRYCDYAAACHFEECCGDKARRRRALTAAEFWEGLRRKERDGHGV